jgi:hypothetical protein
LSLQETEFYTNVGAYIIPISRSETTVSWQQTECIPIFPQVKRGDIIIRVDWTGEIFTGSL